MTRETAQAIGDLIDRAIRPAVTVMLTASICWIGVRSIHNISADQFVGIVMAALLFWFSSRSSQDAKPASAVAVATSEPAK